MAKGDARGEAPTDTAYDGSDVTPNDGANLPDGPCRALWCAVSGTLRITTRGGTVLNFTAAEFPAGQVFPWSAVKVHATGTTASGIKAVY